MNGAPAVATAIDRHTATLIFLHGLGDNGHGWHETFKEPNVRAAHIKYVFPHAANRPITLNLGLRMPAWYDLFGLTPESMEDDEGIAAATKIVHQLIDDEVAAGIPSDRIMIGGFSMGAALSLWAAHTYPHKLAGCVALSGFLLQRNKLPAAVAKSNRNVPVFMGHGSTDMLVPLQIGRLTEQKLKSWNSNVQLHVYQKLGHSSSDKEIEDVARFVLDTLPEPVQPSDPAY